MPGVIVLDALDAADVRRWSETAVALLAANRAEIDAVNVFPVPDGDTGTNMLATLRAADAALTGTETSAAHALAAMSRGAALGAIGNSGFILSQLLRGLAEAVAAAGRWDAEAFAAGLDQGARLGRLAVVTPVEGTILTVSRAAADAARASASGMAGVLAAAIDAADAAVARTPSQLPDLGEAGVVDAGGLGLLVLLDALNRVVTGNPAPLTRHTRPPRPGGPTPAPRHDFGFEVQYLLDAPSSAVAALRSSLATVGDSVAVVAAGERTWKVHVHVDDVGAAVEAGIEAGRPRQISVVRMIDNDEPTMPGPVAVVAIAPGAGLAHLFESEGVHVIEGGDGGEPSTDDVVGAIHAVGARELVLLPNAERMTGVARAAAERVRGEGVRVSVVPTRSPVQGLAAIAVHDPARRFDDDVVAMAEAAAATRFAQVTVARDRALTAVGICEPGDVLGLIDGEVVDVGRGLMAVTFGLIDRLLGIGAELMTILVGADAPHRAGEVIEAHVRARAPFTDVSVYEGGQPDHPVIIGIE